ncbi:N-acetylmuramoyl-L-alanine amidase family protein [Ligilactobacillus sp.]|uniref:N-acetylmuramoyl-L-alanine amidase family protein n=1 Tax=Ligilactobacillus sp. TaxID=2767921 RepID=UPI002FE1252E
MQASSVRQGQQYINGHWYLFDNKGHYKTGFQWIANQRKTVYYNSRGEMQYGQQKIGGHWYLFDNGSGAMKTGLQYIANQRKTVYYNSRGEMQYGYQTVNGHHYYFNTSSGALEPLPSTGSPRTTQNRQYGFTLNGHNYAIKSFSGTGTVPADSYVYAWTSLRNYYLFEYYGSAHKELASLHVGSPVVINGQTLHVREIITNVSNNGNAYDLVARKMQQYKAGWQTCEYAAYGSTLRLWFAN